MHAIVDGAIAGLFPSHPVLVVAAGFASHLAIDGSRTWITPFRRLGRLPRAPL